MSLRYGSLFSGVEAATLAWEPLGFRPAFFAEIDPFCRKVLSHRWPGVPNLGDVTADDFVERAKALGPIDVLVGGSPCQAFSQSGKRKGFGDDRGNLTKVFWRVASEIKPAWVLWENVPGVLSNDGGRTFGAVLGEVVRGGFLEFAWRILDSQYARVPQRRRRVFVVACSGEGCAAKVLLEPQGEGRDSPAGGEAGAETAGVVAKGAGHVRVFSNSGTCCWSESVGTLRARDCKDGEGQGLVVCAEHPTTGLGNTTAPCLRTPGIGIADNGTCYALNATAPHAVCVTGSVTHTLTNEGADASEDGTGRGTPVVAFQERGREGGRSLEYQEELAYALTSPAGGGRGQERNIVDQRLVVRRLTPRECERLQAMPDDHTLVPVGIAKDKRIKWATDSQRYKAVGNSMTVTVMRQIGERILAEHNKKGASDAS